MRHQLQVCEPDGERGYCKNALGDPCKKTIGGTMCASKIYLEDRKTTCKKNWEGKAGACRKMVGKNEGGKNVFAGVIATILMDSLALFSL